MYSDKYKINKTLIMKFKMTSTMWYITNTFTTDKFKLYETKNYLSIWFLKFFHLEINNPI